jgi:hypothetical protein
MVQVIQGSNTNVVVVDNPRTVTAVTAASSAVQVSSPEQVGAISDQATVLGVASTGVQGPRGPAGASASGIPTLNFAFGDATPATVLSLGENLEITWISLQIEEAFDGVGAQIQLGTAASPGLLMDSWQSDPSAALTFEVSPRVELSSGTAIILTIIPGSGASQGRGQFVINAVPTA